ncbi:hypothetical protein DB30_07241 [Enhygromyxa salina]|uniref:Uncharacterized protein n=1 Tax=Enhygromyxa salina TaxID=215803 RepID=A0A0C2DBT4_9BACT|nr:hypothetical protein [Enhygromyxa salina]KIG18905.1 hypothetical protein DB30_07241 [Enhygromyxa salina]
MRAATLTLAILAGCAQPGPQPCVQPAPATPAPTPAHRQHPEGGNDQHFCCAHVERESLTGTDCMAIGVESINACERVLYCAERWTRQGDTVACVGEHPCPGVYVIQDGVVTCAD